MFTDTHCHLLKTAARGVSLAELFEQMSQANFPLVLDAGTDYNDLPERLETLNAFCGVGCVPDVYVSAGIWPSQEAINNRFEYISVLETLIRQANTTSCKTVNALGECGLDRHWNTDPSLFSAELELFELQIQLSQRLELPLIVHSRDALEETLFCLKNNPVKKGVIHCYSYDAASIACFLDLGFYISLSGSVTYAKNNANDELIRAIAPDRLLLETDSPYLSPVPLRSKVNTCMHIEHTYRYCARALGIEVEQLCATVKSNALNLFGSQLSRP